ncbi:hypothetical protein AVEN_218571-1 [Araneus ventricosus]|uniref:Uncharacterized protein n=1 Tax=Araneus ventricosus TaxID=182803 RepID=A0A4Y2R5Y6_ARAVE|nr:hypothetical protein AVEN_218571-1 [Araneus ventricosus]
MNPLGKREFCYLFFIPPAEEYGPSSEWTYLISKSLLYPVGNENPLTSIPSSRRQGLHRIGGILIPNHYYPFRERRIDRNLPSLQQEIWVFIGLEVSSIPNHYCTLIRKLRTAYPPSLQQEIHGFLMIEVSDSKSLLKSY